MDTLCITIDVNTMALGRSEWSKRDACSETSMGKQNCTFLNNEGIDSTGTTNDGKWATGGIDVKVVNIKA